MTTDAAQNTLDLTVLAPAHNEEDNIDTLVDEVGQVLSKLNIRFEMLIVDDGSTDTTLDKLTAKQKQYAWLRVLRMTDTPPGKGNGQSAAFFAGIHASRGSLIALMDADLQNDPADLPAMLEAMRALNADMVQGDRSANRRDTAVRRFSSWVGRTFRRVLLGDTIRDTGCSLRIMKRWIAEQLPLQYKGMHRFIPFYARVLGGKVIEQPVHHRPRIAGQAKYGMWNRAIPGLIDLFAAKWMRSRLRPVKSKPHES